MTSAARPFRVLRSKPLWMSNGVIVGVLAILFAVFYVGANIDPPGHMHHLPVGLVNADKGATVGGKEVDLGAQITGSIKKSKASGDKIEWKVMDEKEVKKELGKGKLYGALVVPRDFSASVAALTTPSHGTPVRPALTVLTNQSAGSLGSSLARQATTTAAQSASVSVGKDLTRQVEAAQAKAVKAAQAKAAKAAHAKGAKAPNAQGATSEAAAAQTQLPTAARLLLADPAAVHIEDGHPLDSHSGLGLTAFYYSLVLVVCGMLSANVIGGQVDHALGYTHNDMGPLRKHNPLVRATRVQTLAISSTLMIGLSIVMASLAMAGAIGIMGMDASHLPLLWLYSVAAIAVCGIGALSLIAVFGTPGMLLVTLFYIAMAVPTAGATTPVQALPGFYRFLAEFEPLRQITGGVRSILYYGAQGDAGLTRGWIMLGVGLLAAGLFGFGMTRLYDRKGLHRIPHEAGEPERAAVPA